MNKSNGRGHVPQGSECTSVSPVVRRRVAELLDALSAECEALAENENAPPDSYQRVLSDIETVAEILRESDLGSRPAEQGTEWTLADRAKDAAVARTIDRRSPERVRRCSPTPEEARSTIAELRAEDLVRRDVQRALG